jgi:tRNA nucleotidyltransferase (CCA-adding enzyme)
VNGDQFEVTTLRIDTETDGRHAVVAYTRDFEADAARRDLTINAMSMDFDGNIYDYFGGQEDLQNYRVRFVGDADARVKEDYLRILRYFRFMARFGNINQCLDEVKDICTKENLEGLKTVSVERYWLEMQKLVTSLYANEVLDCMYYHGVLKALGLGKRRHCTIKQSAVGALGTMLNVDTLGDFISKWKLSTDESKHLRWVVENLYKNWDWRELLVDGIPRQWILDLSRIERDQFMPIHVANWKIPVFPVTGQDLLDRGMNPGVELGNTLRALRQEWKDSNFRMTKEGLLA